MPLRTENDEIITNYAPHWYWERIANQKAPTDAEYDTYLSNFSAFLKQAQAPTVHLTLLVPGAVQISAMQRERFAQLLDAESHGVLKGVAVVAPTVILRGGVMVFNWVVKKDPQPRVFATPQDALAWLNTLLPRDAAGELRASLQKADLLESRRLQRSPVPG
ncbi:MAG: hypothetical protein RBU37_28480 [Myxococcota bacterium]|jgi:hypothetical protein|nr:hypothetical protein [Myxococcota bacterium]